MEQPELAPESHERPKLHSVNLETGELVERGCSGCEIRDEEIRGLETEKRSWRSRYYAAVDDKEAKARAHKLWPRAVRLFDLHRRLTGHMRCEWTVDRFWLCVPFLKKYDDDTLIQAIRGIAYQPYSKPMRNGEIERYDFWENLFSKAGNIERMRNRAPRPRPGRPLAAPAHARKVAQMLLDRAHLIEQSDDELEIARLLVEMDALNREWLGSAWNSCGYGEENDPLAEIERWTTSLGSRADVERRVTALENES